MKYGNQTGLVALIAAATLAISNPAMADPVKGCYGATYTSLDVLEIADGHMVISYSAFGTGYVLEDTASARGEPARNGWAMHRCLRACSAHPVPWTQVCLTRRA